MSASLYCVPFDSMATRSSASLCGEYCVGCDIEATHVLSHLILA